MLSHLPPHSSAVKTTKINNELIGLITFILICVAISVQFHRKIRKPIKATLYSAVTATIIFQLMAGIGPFFQRAFIISFGIAFVIALFVGIPFEYRRRKADNANNQFS